MRVAKGNYKGKHPSETVPDPVIVDAVRKKLVNDSVTCTDAEEISLTLSKSMLDVGTVVDILEAPIIKCQLGLFGYYPQQKIVSPAQTIDPKIEAAIRNKCINGLLPCYDAWEIAKAFAQPRIHIASVCEARGIKIGPCQLGAF